MNTIPYHICITRRDDCVSEYNGSSVGQANCRSTFDCSTKDPTDYTLPSTTTTSSGPTSTPTKSSTAAGTSSTPTKGAAVKLGQTYGVGVFAVVVAGAFGLAL
jgi:hypothetical protein